MNNMQAGANIAIEQTQVLDVVVSWLPQNSAIEVCAFNLNNTDKVRSNDDFIYRNRLTSQDSFILSSLSATQQIFHIELEKIPSDIQKIVFTIAAKDPLTELFDLKIEINQLAVFVPNREPMQSLILGELYLRNQQWKFRAIGQGFQQDLTFLENRYGVDIEDEASRALVLADTETQVQVIEDPDLERLPPAKRGKLHHAIITKVNLIKNLSKLWMLWSFIIFIAVELFLGGLVGQVVVGRFIPHALTYLIEVILLLSSFFVGGAIVGFISPQIRILEPALAAFLCMMLTFSISFFSPYHFMSFSWTRLLIGGGIAFALAWLGAHFGEKLSAKLGNQNSKEYFGDD